MTTVLCVCKAYNGKPHQVGRGRCPGSDWVESLFRWGHEFCESCQCNVDGNCEVGEGRESIEECPIYQRVLVGDLPKHFHPIFDQESFRQKMINSQEQEIFERPQQEESYDDVPF